MAGVVPVLFHILAESTGYLGVHSCPGTPWQRHGHKVYVKHNELIGQVHSYELILLLMDKMTS